MLWLQNLWWLLGKKNVSVFFLLNSVCKNKRLFLCSFDVKMVVLSNLFSEMSFRCATWFKHIMHMIKCEYPTQCNVTIGCTYVLVLYIISACKYWFIKHTEQRLIAGKASSVKYKTSTMLISYRINLKVIRNPPIVYSQENSHFSLSFICSCHGTTHVISYNTKHLVA